MRARFDALGAPARLAAFGILLAVVGTLAALVGAATGSGSVATPASGGEMAMDEATQLQANGLASSAGGYTFVPERATLPLGTTTAFRFRIVDDTGAPVRDFDV